MSAIEVTFSFIITSISNFFSLPSSNLSLIKSFWGIFSFTLFTSTWLKTEILVSSGKFLRTFLILSSVISVPFGIIKVSGISLYKNAFGIFPSTFVLIRKVLLNNTPLYFSITSNVYSPLTKSPIKVLFCACFKGISISSEEFLSLAIILNSISLPLSFSATSLETVIFWIKSAVLYPLVSYHSDSFLAFILIPEISKFLVLFLDIRIVFKNLKLLLSLWTTLSLNPSVTL